MLKYINIFYSTLSTFYKNQIFLIFIMVLLSIFFDTLGIGMIVPIVGLLIDQSIVEKYPFFSSVLEFLGNPNEEKLLIYFVYFLILLFILKNIFQAALIWLKTSFVYSISNHYTSKLLKIYLKKPYSFHQNINSSKIINILTNEVALASGGFVLSLIDIIVESLLLLAILTLLILVEPQITIIILSIFLFCGYSYYLLVKKKILKMSYLRQTLNSLRLKYFNETFRNIKFYLVNKKLNKIIFDIKNNLQEIKKINVIYTFINLFPKQIFELLIIIIFSLIILNFATLSKDLNNLVPVLALYAAASFRILPSTNKILLKFNEIRYSKSAIEVLGKELKNEILEKNDDITFGNINFEKLSLKNVYFKYEKREKYTLENISLDINKNKIYGFYGDSGSGKTTLSDLIMCLQKADSGEIILNNKENLYDNKNSWQSIIGYVPQNIFIFDETIKNNIALGEFNNQIDLNKLNNSIKEAQLEKFISNLDEGIETIVGENGSNISGGQMQRIAIARALYLSPQVLILDEFTSSLDSEVEKQILNEIKKLKKNKTIILITHNLNSLKICDEIFKIDNGKLIKKNNLPETNN